MSQQQQQRAASWLLSQPVSSCSKTAPPPHPPLLATPSLSTLDRHMLIRNPLSHSLSANLTKAQRNHHTRIPRHPDSGDLDAVVQTPSFLRLTAVPGPPRFCNPGQCSQRAGMLHDLTPGASLSFLSLTSPSSSALAGLRSNCSGCCCALVFVRTERPAEISRGAVTLAY